MGRLSSGMAALLAFFIFLLSSPLTTFFPRPRAPHAPFINWGIEAGFSEYKEIAVLVTGPVLRVVIALLRRMQRFNIYSSIILHGVRFIFHRIGLQPKGCRSGRTFWFLESPGRDLNPRDLLTEAGPRPC
jgi:hypothetical protein